MQLAHLLTEPQVILDIRATHRLPAIAEMLDQMVALDLVDGGMREELLGRLRERERQASTGVGRGVAIPHAFSGKIDEVVAVFGRSRSGIDFDALDGMPVKLVVLFVVPERDYQMHLRTLAAIARMFLRPKICARLLGAGDQTEILEILAGGGVRNSV